MKNTLTAFVLGLLSLGFIQSAVAQTAPSGTTRVKFEAAQKAGGPSETFTADGENTLYHKSMWDGSRLNAAMAIAANCAEYNQAPTTTTEGLKCVVKPYRQLKDRKIKVHANENPACSMEVSKDDCNCTTVPKITFGPQTPKTTAAALEEIKNLSDFLLAE
jgi:hypothetical protein